MKAAALLGLILGVCVARPGAAQTTYVDWVSGKTGEGFDAVHTMAKPPARAALAALCLPSGVGVRIEFGKAFGSAADNSVRVSYQFDTSPGQAPANWPLSFGGNTTAQIPGSRVRQFASKGKPANEVSMRVIDPLSGEPVDFVFSMKGFADALAALPCAKGY
ncbi:MAG: hypothetical protein FIB01_07525 [Gemmatimonadetes bacterium]|nr:hypothetical protein [Gemmatimonadota bacterium]